MNQIGQDLEEIPMSSGIANENANPVSPSNEPVNPDNSESEEKTLKDIFLDWMSNSTAHAMPRVFKDYQLQIKLFWLFLMLAAWASASYFVIIYFIKFFQYGVNVNVELVEEIPTQFPTIDICNLTPYDGNTAIDSVVNNINSNEGLGGTHKGDTGTSPFSSFPDDDLGTIIGTSAISNAAATTTTSNLTVSIEFYSN
jgi:hypothetical protein